jgi:hypothetical protein
MTRPKTKILVGGTRPHRISDNSRRGSLGFWRIEAGHAALKYPKESVRWSGLCFVKVLMFA